MSLFPPRASLSPRFARALTALAAIFCANFAQAQTQIPSAAPSETPIERNSAATPTSDISPSAPVSSEISPAKDKTNALNATNRASKIDAENRNASTPETSPSRADASVDAPTTDISTMDVSIDAPVNPLLQRALQATPPTRASFALPLSTPENLADIDTWIQNTSVDHPQNLILKDILIAMPPRLAGPRIVELAKKASEIPIQESYARWLQKYPEAYAQVLYAWIKQNSGQTARFLALLEQYAALRPKQAYAIWAQLIVRYPISELGGIAAFGYAHAECMPALVAALSAANDEISRLRAARALTHCAIKDPTTPMPTAIADVAANFLKSDLPSRRIVALELYGALPSKDPQTLEAIARIFDDAKNTTERAFALQTLQILDPDAHKQAARLRDALVNGDEILRLQAASLIASDDTPHAIKVNFTHDEFEKAFAKEIWPETQIMLYKAISQNAANPDALLALQKSILQDPTRATRLRLNVLDDIAKEHPKTLSFQTMASIQGEDEPKLDLIAAFAEALYRTSPSARPDLRAWLKLQHPFERRLMTTFARFIRYDRESHEAPTAALDTMRTICGSQPIQDGIIRPCLNYFEDIGDSNLSDDDRKIMQNLQSRQNLLDQMFGYEL